MCRAETLPKYLVILILLVIHVESTLHQPQTVKLGGMFDIRDPYEETAFLHAADRVNSDQNAFKMFNIGAMLEKVQRGDSYNASKQVCKLLQEGIAGIIGPQTPVTASHVQSVSEVFHIPRIETNWDFRGNRSRGQFLINLYPHPATLSKAYADVIRDFGWSEVIIIYENNESLIRLQGIFELTGDVIKQYVVKLLPNNEEGDDFRPLMKDLKTNFHSVNHIILDCHTSKLRRIFEDAKTENMLTHAHEYFLTSLDIHILDPSDEAFQNVNITAFRLVDPANPKLHAIRESWNVNSALVGKRADFSGQDPFRVPRHKYDSNSFPNLTLDMFMVDTALIYDAVELFASGLDKFSKELRQELQTEVLDCDFFPIRYWSQGHEFMKALKDVTFQGVSGDIRIDDDGKRRKFKMEVVELTNNNITVVGVWSSLGQRQNLNWTRDESETLKFQIQVLKGQTFIVTTKESLPYITFFENGTTPEGYSVDLIQKLAEQLEFNYVFKKVDDGKMGSPDPSSKHGWNGLIGEILEDKAQLAIGDMSITSARASAIDFSLPFMNIGISILYMKPEKRAPNLFSFLDPFHYEVWIYMATAYLGVSLTLFILARITPYEWLNPHPCIESPDELELTLHLVNSLWFTTGTLMQQGSDIAPKAGSTRLVAGSWWFFTLIVISSYTANLAAFLTSEGMVEGIRDIKDLPKQTKVKYGTLFSGTTRDFFRDSTFPLYAEIGKNMEGMSPLPHVESTNKGVEKVLASKGEFAFFMESAGIEYATERECSLVQLGVPLDSKGFGIGFRKGFKFRNAFNIQLLNMSQNGELETLKNKWWSSHEKGGGKCKTEKSSDSGAKPLTLGHVGGVFVVLLGGCITAVIVGILEFMWKARKLRKEVQSSYWSEVWKELKFALQCQNEFKPIKKSLSMNPTMQSESVPYLAFNNGGGNGNPSEKSVTGNIES